MLSSTFTLQLRGRQGGKAKSLSNTVPRYIVPGSLQPDVAAQLLELMRTMANAGYDCLPPQTRGPASKSKGAGAGAGAGAGVGAGAGAGAGKGKKKEARRRFTDEATLAKWSMWGAYLIMSARLLLLTSPMEVASKLHTLALATQDPHLWASLGALAVVGPCCDETQLLLLQPSDNIPTRAVAQQKCCDNHDDGVTEARWGCATCGAAEGPEECPSGVWNLCDACDSTFHLRKLKRDHARVAIQPSVTEVRWSCGLPRRVFFFSLSSFRLAFFFGLLVLPSTQC